MSRAHLLLLPLLALPACVGPRPSRLAGSEGAQVVVKSVRIPDTMPWYTRLAEHMWVDLRPDPEGSWWRLEVQGSYSGVDVVRITEEEAHDDLRWGNEAFVLARLEGPRAASASERLLAVARAHPDFGRWVSEIDDEGSGTLRREDPSREEYEAWPGPNSNTFVADLVTAVPELGVELHHNAVGKDYARGVRAAATPGGLGVAVDTDYLGLGVGLREGVELHLVGLTVGATLWPPALKLPFVPRLGVHQGWVNGGL